MLETEKGKYLIRDKVRMTISVKDVRSAHAGELSMAVVNDQLLAFADDKSGNIVSQMLLQSRIFVKKVEEPAFYFNKKNPNRLKRRLPPDDFRGGEGLPGKLIEQDLRHYSPARTESCWRKSY